MRDETVCVLAQVCGCVFQVHICAIFFLLQRKRNRQREHCNAEGLSGTGSSVNKIAWTTDGKSNYPFLSHTHTLSCRKDRSKETVNDGLPDVFILCLLAFSADEMNVSLMPLSALCSVLFSGLLGTSLTLWWMKPSIICALLSLYGVSSPSCLWSLRVVRFASIGFCKHLPLKNIYIEVIHMCYSWVNCQSMHNF